MRKRKSLIRRLLPWAIAAALTAALVIFVGIPLYGQQEEEESRPPVIAFYGGDGKPLKMENGSLLFEMDPKTTQFTVTEKGCTSLPLPYSPPDGDFFRDDALCCSYRCDIRPDAAVFTLWRTPEDLADLLTQAQALGIRRTVGLYQQLRKDPLTEPNQ